MTHFPDAPIDRCSAWISPLLRGKHAWERGEHGQAVQHIEEILAEPHGLPVLYVPPGLLDDSAAMTFELFVCRLVTDRFLLIPFAPAITRLWRALPAQYVLLCMDQRQAFEGDLDDEALEIVYGAAEDGILSFEREDYDCVAKVLFTPADYEHLASCLDVARIEQLVSSAAERAAWDAYVDAHGELVTSLVLHTAFHRGKVLHATTVRDVLCRLTERQPRAIDAAARRLRWWIDAGADLTDLARIGIGNDAGSPQCVTALAAVLEGGDFDALRACIE